VPIVVEVWAILTTPASWLGEIWTQQLGFPPHGEIAWAVPPAVASVMLWSVFGLLFGLWRCSRLRQILTATAAANETTPPRMKV
jgi:hypothetical protein